MATFDGDDLGLITGYADSAKLATVVNGCVLNLAGGSDTVAPAVTNITPPASTDLLPDDVVGFDVTDETSLKKVIIIAKFFGNAIWETVFDGVKFAPIYADSSVVTVIANGFHFDTQRLSGWPSRPEILIIAFDDGGNEAEN